VNIRDWFQFVKIYARHEEGQTMAEYGVVLAVIVIGVIVALGFLAAAVTGKLDSVTTKLGGAIS
jgi:Flp pilus assembly pilin Flp